MTPAWPSLPERVPTKTLRCRCLKRQPGEETLKITGINHISVLALGVSCSTQTELPPCFCLQQQPFANPPSLFHFPSLTKAKTYP